MPKETIQVSSHIMAKLNRTLMPFGKHINEPLGDVPRHYLEWLVDNSAEETTLLFCIELYLDLTPGEVT